jgi:hypothetical protein
MDDRGNRMIVERGAQRDDVADIGRHAGNRAAGQGFETSADRRRAVAEIVEDDWGESGTRQLDDDVGTYESGTAGDQNCLGHGT